MKTVGINNVGSPKGSNQPLSTERDAALRSIYWVPVGFAAAVSLGDGSSPLILLPALALLALVHSRAPAALSLTVGAIALAVSLVSAVGADYETGYTIPLALAGYGGIVALMAFVSALGGGGRDKVARQMIVAVAAIELALFTSSPIGKVPEGFGPATSVVAVLVIVTVVAGASDFGYFLTSTALMTVLIVLAVAGSPYGHSSPLVLAGTLAFSQLGVLFTLRKEDGERARLLAANDDWHASL